jgi:hypothetical protein
MFLPPPSENDPYIYGALLVAVTCLIILVAFAEAAA